MRREMATAMWRFNMLEKIYNLFNEYASSSCGLSKETDSTNYVYIEAKNMISNSEFHKNPIVCRIEVYKSANPDEVTPYRLNYYEKSFCVLGGGGGFYADYEILEAVEKELKRYKFRKKGV